MFVCCVYVHVFIDVMCIRVCVDCASMCMCMFLWMCVHVFIHVQLGMRVCVLNVYVEPHDSIDIGARSPGLDRKSTRLNSSH